MAEYMLESGAISAFCESIATMLSAGIQTDEAVHLLGENMEETSFKRICNRVYTGVASGKTLAQAMADTNCFPEYAVNTVRTGEQSGRTEAVLRSLAAYYDEEERLFSKVNSAIGYPAALLCVMSVILAFTVAVILPVFTNVYEGLSGTLTSGSFSAVAIAIGIGWVALILTLVCTVVALLGSFACKTEIGRQAVMRAMEHFPVTKQAMYQLALSRFTSTVGTYLASGVNADTAMHDAIDMVGHKALRKKLQPAYEQMIDHTTAKSLAQAIYDNDIYEPVYARMLMVGARSGSTDDVLDHLSDTFFDDAVMQIDRSIDNIEPALAAFMTLAVGAVLISVMLPLIGIMSSIG